MSVPHRVTTIAKSSFTDGKVFIHLIPMSELGLDIFLTINVLERSGYVPEMVKMDTELIVDVEYDEKNRPRASKVHSVGGRLPAVAEAVLTQPLTLLASQVTTANIDQFLNPVKAGENLATGEVLWRIRDAEDAFIQYIVCDLIGNLIRQLGAISSNDARQDIGLEAKASKARIARRRRLIEQTLMAAE